MEHQGIIDLMDNYKSAIKIQYKNQQNMTQIVKSRSKP